MPLDVCVDIVVTNCTIWIFVVCYVVDLPFVDERCIDNPWRVGDDFIYPTTMTCSFTPVFDKLKCSLRNIEYIPLGMVHYTVRFVLFN